MPATIQNAQSTPLFSQSAQYFASFMPDDYSDKLSSSLIDHKGVNATAAEAIDNMIDNGADILKKPLELLNDEKPTDHAQQKPTGPFNAHMQRLTQPCN